MSIIDLAKGILDGSIVPVAIEVRREGITETYPIQLQTKIRCAIIAQKGNSISSFIFDTDELIDNKWITRDVIIRDRTFIVISNSKVTSGLNKRVSNLINCQVYGPVIFMAKNEQTSNPMNLDLAMFKKYVLFN